MTAAVPDRLTMQHAILVLVHCDLVTTHELVQVHAHFGRRLSLVLTLLLLRFISAVLLFVLQANKHTLAQC